MTTVDLVLRPRDPLVLRDARPFAADPGARAFSLDWPLPGTLAGALRSRAGADLAIDWNNALAREPLSEIEVQGALAVACRAGEERWMPFLPAPQDAVPYTPDGGTPTLMCLRPDNLADDEGVTGTAISDRNGVGERLSALLANLAPVRVTEEVKPDTGASFWSLADIAVWLTIGSQTDWDQRLPRGRLPARGLPSAPKETRTHVGVMRETLTAEEGRLFATTGVAFAPGAGVGHPVREADRRLLAERRPGPDQKDPPPPVETAMLCRVTVPDDLRWTPSGFLPLGGERRQTILLPNPKLQLDPWQPPGEVVTALIGATGLRLQLVTPAIFDRGWLPRWLDDPREAPEPLRGLLGRLTLRGAALGRRVAISGWALSRKDGTSPTGYEKPTRYAVPPGSVYFFEVTGHALTQEEIEALWMAPLSDREFDRRDGLGLAIPGIWHVEGRGNDA